MSTGKGRAHFSVPGGLKNASKRDAGQGKYKHHRSERLAVCDAEKARAEAQVLPRCQGRVPVLRSAGANSPRVCRMPVHLHLPQHIESEKLRRVAGSELWKSVAHWAPFTSSLFLDLFFRTPGVRPISLAHLPSLQSPDWLSRAAARFPRL
jgi:hypothetical protein